MIAALLLVLLWLKRAPLKLSSNNALFDSDPKAFLGQLDIAVRSHLNVFPSLPVIDVLKARRFSRGKVALRTLSKQRFDFVLYHRREMNIRCAIKLIPYGKSSDNKEMKLLRKACESAGLTLLEYEMKPYRNVSELRRVVFSACGIDELDKVDQEVTVEEPAFPPKPSCPKCQKIMELTVIKKGTYAGQECWICSAYPTCKGARLHNAQS